MENAISILVGLIGVPLVQWLKGELKWEGRKASLLQIAMAVVFAIAGLFISEAVKLQEFSWENLPAVFMQVLIASEFAYKLFVKKE